MQVYQLLAKWSECQSVGMSVTITAQNICNMCLRVIEAFRQQQHLTDSERNRWNSLYVVLTGRRYRNHISSGGVPPALPYPADAKISKRQYEKALCQLRKAL